MVLSLFNISTKRPTYKLIYNLMCFIKDVTWLDKCITGTIEFFENVFRWEVIDVKK